LIWGARLRLVGAAAVLAATPAAAQTPPDPPLCLWTSPGDFKACPDGLPPGCYRLEGGAWKSWECPVLNPLYAAKPKHPLLGPQKCKVLPSACRPHNATPTLTH